MPDPPPAAALPASPAAAPPPSEAAELEIGTLEATLPPLPSPHGAGRPGSITPSTPAPIPAEEP